MASTRGRSEPGRRTVLAGLLGGAGLALTACGGGDAAPAAGGSASASTTGEGSASAGSATSSSPATASAAQIASRATIPVLCYHQVRDWEGGDTAYNKQLLICPPANFAAQLDAIKGAGYTAITPAQYDEHLRGGGGLPPKPVVITLDDGKDNQISQALPALAKRGMTATFFVMTVILGNPGWMSRDDVKRVADAGMTVGSHTWDHHMVTKYTGKDWAIQFNEPRTLLARLSGQPVTTFAYPYGAWNEAALPHLREAGYTTAFQLDEKPMDRVHPELTLRRKLAVSTWTGPQAVAELDKMRTGAGRS